MGTFSSGYRSLFPTKHDSIFISYLYLVNVTSWPCPISYDHADMGCFRTVEKPCLLALPKLEDRTGHKDIRYFPGEYLADLGLSITLKVPLAAVRR